MRDFILGFGYTLIGITNVTTTWDFLSEHKRKIKINNRVESQVYIITGITSAVLWPVTLPLMIYLDNKWKSHD